MTTTLLQLRDRAKQESDNVGQSFVSDAEWNSYLSSSYAELYGLIVEAFGNDYFVQSPSAGYTFTTDGVNQFFALPGDFFKLLGVDLRVNTSPSAYVSLCAFRFMDRNRFSAFNSQVPVAGQTLRILYVPRFTPLTADADTVDGVNGWEEYIVCDACIKALAKEESDVSIFGARKAALLERLSAEVASRDAGAGATVVGDVYGRRAMGMQYRLNGNSLWLIGGSTPGYWPYGDWSSDLGMWGW